MRGRGLRRTPHNWGSKLHRMESEGAIGKRDSADLVMDQVHARGGRQQAPTAHSAQRKGRT